MSSLYAVASCPNCAHAIGMRHEVFTANITHNLGAMANAAGIYEACWRPESLTPKPHASDLIEPLRAGLSKLKANPSHFETFNAPNGWGLYKHFVPWVERYLEACEANPTAEVEVSR